MRFEFSDIVGASSRVSDMLGSRYSCAARWDRNELSIIIRACCYNILFIVFPIYIYFHLAHHHPPIHLPTRPTDRPTTSGADQDRQEDEGAQDEVRRCGTIGHRLQRSRLPLLLREHAFEPLQGRAASLPRRFGRERRDGGRRRRSRRRRGGGGQRG